MTLLSTVGDARAAMQALNNDIVGAASDVATSYASANIVTQLSGADMVTEASASILNQLAGTWLKVNDSLTGDDTDDLSDDQVAALQELQSEVISDRKLVGEAISSVDWTFGDLASDVVTQTVNLGSQAVAAVKSAIPAVPWLAIEIGLGAVAAVVVYAIYRRVSGR